MRALKLEEFLENPQMPAGGQHATQAADPLGEGGYDRGYQAGWDDAIRSVEDTQTHIDAELGRNLEALSFTFHEAQRQVCLSLEGLVSALLTQVLPPLYHEHVPHLIERVLLPAVEQAGHVTAELTCAPQDLEQVNELIARHGHLPISVRPEPSLARHQLRLELGNTCHELDADQLLSDLRTAMETLFSDQRKGLAHAS